MRIRSFEEDVRLAEYLEHLVQRQELRLFRFRDVDLLFPGPLKLFILLIVHHQMPENRDNLACHEDDRLTKPDHPNLPGEERIKL